MTCDTRIRPRQSLTERKDEVRRVIARLAALLASRAVRPVIGPTGGLTFGGWEEIDRGAISDACAYRLLKASGATLALATIARAEATAGRSINAAALASGLHSHDGGKTWSTHKH